MAEGIDTLLDFLVGFVGEPAFSSGADEARDDDVQENDRDDYDEGDNPDHDSMIEGPVFDLIACRLVLRLEGKAY